MTTLTSEAKALLSRTVRELRARLLLDLHAEAERRYRLSIPIEKAKLAEEARRKRERLEAWIEERVRASGASGQKALAAAQARFLADGVKEAASTFFNRIVLLRHLEALGLSRPAVVTGGWNSRGYRELREFAPDLLGDETEGYALLLELLCDEHAQELPGLFGEVGLTRLFPVPPATLREVVERLDDPGLATAWTDDTTLGWVYQYWNDPEREALDAKLNDGGKIEPHEIASKTQMFTERYMVEWLLQNSLGLMWLCICKKHGWTPDAERVLPVLEERRAEWRRKREVGEVALDALMPIEGELEEQWKYYVPQPIPDDAVEKAPESVRTIRLLDPACGSGHFLVIAFDMLAAMYREEARHRGEEWGDREIAEAILENNLHGIDIDPRCTQIAAAAVWLKAKRFARDARPRRVNLVAPVLRLAELPEDDPALVRLRRELREEAGIPEELTMRLVKALAGVDHLGSLLKVDAAIDEAIGELERAAGVTDPGQGDLLTSTFPKQQARFDWSGARATVVERLEAFLSRHAGEDDLGLRLDGEQLAAGVRFVRMMREGSYDVVVANPPYHGASRLGRTAYLARLYPDGKADLYSAFLLRSVELCRLGGAAALVTMRGWMFLSQFANLRTQLAPKLRAIADVGWGAFEQMTDNPVTMTVIARMTQQREHVAIAPSPSRQRIRTDENYRQIISGLWCQSHRHSFDPRLFAFIEDKPWIYWWSRDDFNTYYRLPKLADHAPARFGLTTGNNARFVRKHFELPRKAVATMAEPGKVRPEVRWVPFVMGAAGRSWVEALTDVVRWASSALELKVFAEISPGAALRNPDYYFRIGVAFSMVGDRFTSRVHRYPSVFSNKGSSLFPPDPGAVVCMLNTRRSAAILESLNPGIGFEVGDVNRLPVLPIQRAGEIWSRIECSFGDLEKTREPSIEFLRPGPNCWDWTVSWAQHAVDRSAGTPLPSCEPVPAPTPPVDFVSFAVGNALGRFAANGEGIMDEAAPSSALPNGLLFLTDGTEDDSLQHPACAPLLDAWREHGAAVGEGDDLRTYLRKAFFTHHKKVYENRPIYFPLSSAKKNFVAWVSIHRWTSSTLQTLLADYLIPERRRLEGEMDDLRQAKAGGKGNGKAERRFAEVQRFLEELDEFIDRVKECAERGPPPTSAGETPRECDARYEMDLDDGVMVNSAALWPLLEPQWKDPKKWWKELATAKGRKDYDWAHLARRYFPSRVEAKCQEDPSLAVAHGCFWRLHPGKAYGWELRLQDEIRPDFTIDEAGSDGARKAFLRDHEEEAQAIYKKELDRRAKKARKEGQGGNLEMEFGEDADNDPEDVAEEAS